MDKRTCIECGTAFETTSTVKRYCTARCRYKTRDRSRMYPCTVCGEPMHRGSTNRGEGKSIHNRCRSKEHGTTRYRSGCRCDVCRAAVAERQRNYAKQYQERTGQSLRRKYERPTSVSTWISTQRRHAIYERDNWTCQLCMKPVDKTLPALDRMAATLDHIECQSWVLVPDHSDQNLRLAHRSCNSKRRDRLDL